MHYINDLGSVIFVPALGIWVTELSRVSLWIPLVDQPVMPRDMYVGSHLRSDDERRSASILYIIQQCILGRCRDWATQTANCMIQEVMDNEVGLSPELPGSKHWTNLIDLIYDHERMGSLSYHHMVEIGNKVMDSQGHKDVDEANKATLRATGVTPKLIQVIDPKQEVIFMTHMLFEHQ